MSSNDQGSRIDWAKEMEEKEIETEVKIDDGLKKAIDYRTEDDKKYKITNTFKVDKVKMPRPVYERKKLAKFGEAAKDPAGVNPATTIVGDEVYMTILTNNTETSKEAEPQAPSMSKIQCKHCKGDHWSAKCPYKDLYERMAESDNAKKASETQSTITTAPGEKSAYVPPSLRAGATQSVGKKLDYGKGGQRADEYTIRVTNLPEEATEGDLMELFKPFGKVTRTFLAKDKNTQQSRGFAFVNFQNRDDAQRAILGVNGYGYHHLILKVEWSKPSKDS